MEMQAADSLERLRGNIGRVIVGKEKVTNFILTALIAGGHVLLEDVPGTGKTLLAKSLARSIDSEFSRIQFTPDLLPSDITGINYYNPKEGEFVFRAGPVFCNILLADEINRATPRTQSSLLECMEEKQVTLDGITHKLESPFLVIATQNPIETAGTFPLPEAQLDRFFMQISVGLPDKTEELAIMSRFLTDSPFTELTAVCTREDILRLQSEYKKVYIHQVLMEYIADIVQETRKAEGILMGVSPRGSLAMLNAARAYAMLHGRSYVIPEDIKILATPVFAHRLILQRGATGKSGASGKIEEILGNVKVPTEEWIKN